MFTKSTIKWLIYVIGFLLIIAVTFFYLNNQRTISIADEFNVAEKKSVSEPQQRISNTPTTEKNRTSESLLTPEEAAKLNAENLAKITRRRYESNNWHDDRGYMSSEERAIYQGYELSTLQALGKSGNVNALQELGLRASQTENFALAMQYYEAAAVHGSSSVFAYMPTTYELANKLYLDVNNGKEALINAVSYYRVAELRGDYSKSRDITKLLTDFDASAIGRYGKIELTKNDFQTIENRAQGIYSDLESKRIQLGLNSFDNTVPEGTAQIDRDQILAKRAEQEFGL